MPSSSSNDRVIAVANLKGGVGKTTTVLNLAGFAGQFGKRVLMVDTDPQASLTRVALPENAPTTSLTDVFARRARTLDGVRCPSRFAGVDLVPSSLGLEAVIQTAIPWEGREYVLLDMLMPQQPDPIALDALRLPLAGLLVEKSLGDSYAAGSRVVEQVKRRGLPHAGSGGGRDGRKLP